MPLIEAALAFAITMLALSLVVSSFVEVIHRTFKLREAGLKYMLEQLFDQVLAKYVEPLAQAEIDKGKSAPQAYKAVRDDFIMRMTANRAPVGLKPDPTLASKVVRDPRPMRAGRQRLVWWFRNTKPWLRLGNLWGGRRVTALTPTEFMERLGSVDVGDAIRNTAARGPVKAVDATLKTIVDGADNAAQAAIAGGAAPADASHEVLKELMQLLGSDQVRGEIARAASIAEKDAEGVVDAALMDIAQKFDGFGKDAGAYFEGRARFMSVIVAILLAFAVHVDAIDLFKTYLRDPNARAKVIEQSQAVTAQYKAAQEAAGTLEKLVPKQDATSQQAKQPGDVRNNDATSEEAKKAEQTKKAEAAKASDDVKKQIEALQKDTLAAIGEANATAKQYAGLGVPLGWSDDRIADAKMSVWVWTCKELKGGQTERFWTLWQHCKPDDPKPDKVGSGDPKPGDPSTAANGQEGLQYANVWIEVPTAPKVVLYLILGGLLIGLGSPFWYDAVTGLTNMRNAAGGAPGQAQAPAAPPAAAAGGADNAQPVTPVGAFRVSNAAAAIGNN